MIGSALDYVAKQMDTYIKTRLRLNPSAQKVIFTPIMDLDGSLAIQQENVLVFSLVSLQQDPIATRSRPHDHRHAHNVHIAKPPPVHINMYVLLGAYFKPAQVKEGIDMLSMGIRFFQGRPLWTPQNAPGLPTDIDRLTFELESLDFHQQSHLWGAIGAKYFPSAVYKMRMLILDDETIDAIIPTIEKTSGQAS
ncbi:MAG: DUF4255 domain-containing protein [Bacteroidota bacterium]